MTTEQRFSLFRDALTTHGLAGALGILNKNVPHRYTAAYRLSESMLQNQALFDKQGEIRPDFLATVPLEMSFCQFVFRDGVFATTDSASDRRLDGHPYQGVMVSYTGVPITDGAAGGKIIGSLCHFDLVQHAIDDDEFALLQRASRVITANMLRG
ncbi:MAG: hypothetical protein ABWZ88_08485 [Variovorax sp.]